MRIHFGSFSTMGMALPQFPHQNDPRMDAVKGRVRVSPNPNPNPCAASISHIIFCIA